MFADCRSAGARSVACVLVVAGWAGTAGAQQANRGAGIDFGNRPSLITPPAARPAPVPPLAPRVFVPPPDRVIYPRGQDNVIPNWTDTRVIMNPFDTTTKIVRVPAPPPGHGEGPGQCPTGHYWNGSCYVPYPWYTDYWWDGSYTYNPVIQESVPVAAQPAPEPVDLATLPPLERGLALWSGGQRSDAITAVREHLRASPNDADAMRTLAVIMLDDKRFDDAFALMRQAYRIDPSLAALPLDTYKLSLTPTRMRELVVAASAPANKTKSASAWLTLAVLMQGQHRDDLAAKMVRKAGDQGLELKITDAFRANLRDVTTPTPRPKAATAPSAKPAASKPNATPDRSAPAPK